MSKCSQWDTHLLAVTQLKPFINKNSFCFKSKMRRSFVTFGGRKKLCTKIKDIHFNRIKEQKIIMHQKWLMLSLNINYYWLAFFKYFQRFLFIKI